MDFTKLATEQGLAFLIGIAVVAVIQPETAGGFIILMAISIAATNVIIQIGKLILQWRAEKTSKKPTDLD